MESLNDISSADVDLSVPVLRKDMSAGDLMAMLRREADRRHARDGDSPSPSRQSQHRQRLRAVELFARFTAAALRRAAVAEGWGRQTGQAFEYAEAAMRDLAANWITKRVAAAKLGMTLPQYFHWTRDKKIATRVIGKASLVRRADVKAAQREMGVGR